MNGAGEGRGLGDVVNQRSQQLQKAITFCCYYYECGDWYNLYWWVGQQQ